jgi:hypothetical protein
MGTKMEINRTFSSIGTQVEGLQRLIEKKVTTTLGPNENKYIPVDVGFDRYEVRTIFIQNSNNNKYVASIYDKQTNGDIVYKSLEESYTYDIINVPCEDKDGTKSVHLFIQNKDNASSDFTVIIKVTNLL